MKKIALVLGVVAGALTLACSTMKTDVDYDHTINWSSMHTFQLAQGERSPDTFTEKRIEDNITSQLTSKGWQPATSNPDVIVTSHVVLQAEKQWNATGTGGFGRFGGGMAQATQSTVPIGTLVVTMTNPKTGELIWRGAAQDQVSTSGGDNGQIANAIAAIFKNFPPGSAKS